MSSALERDLKHAVEIIPGRLFYCPLAQQPSTVPMNKHLFSIDTELVYWNFYLDFGPLNLGHLYRFCRMLNNKLADPKLKEKQIIFYSSTHPHKRTNAVYLVTSWSLLYNGKTPEEAFAPFRPVAHTFPPWHDATQSICTFQLTILDTLRGLAKARECKFFDFNNFDIDDYEFFEQVENGDMNWYLQGKFIAFAGPHARESAPRGFHTLPPEHYVPHFKAKGVTCVIRLNKRYYDAKSFTSQGIDHLDLYFEDGSNPPDSILYKFIAKCEEHKGAIAVHCKAGLGRTGSCIAAYIMKHYKFTAEEIIGWMRICRPGSIIGPQQQYMKEIQQRMWRDGDEMRAKLGVSPGAISPVTGSAPNSPMFKKDLEDKGEKEDSKISALMLQTNSLSLSSGGSKGNVGDNIGGGASGSVGSAVDQKEAQGDHLRLQRSRLQQLQQQQQQQQQQQRSNVVKRDF